MEALGSEDATGSGDGCGGGAAERSSLGPFGVLVLADESLSELTPIYFNVANSTRHAYFCADEKRYVLNHLFTFQVFTYLLGRLSLRV